MSTRCVLLIAITCGLVHAKTQWMTVNTTFTHACPLTHEIQLSASPSTAAVWQQSSTRDTGPRRLRSVSVLRFTEANTTVHMGVVEWASIQCHRGKDSIEWHCRGLVRVASPRSWARRIVDPTSENDNDDEPERLAQWVTSAVAVLEHCTSGDVCVLRITPEVDADESLMFVDILAWLIGLALIAWATHAWWQM